MRYHNITKEDMLNGDGLRVVLWLSGCEHACEGCQNPITWDPEDGLLFDQAAKEEIFEELNKEYISGITFSGGDPLYPGNRRELLLFILEVAEKYPQKTIWLYTGYLWEEIKQLPLMEKVDVLIDGRFLIDQLDHTLHWRGSANQRIIDVKKSLEMQQIILHEE